MVNWKILGGLKLVAIVRKLGGRPHRLSDHSLDRATADRIAIRTRELGMNAKVVQHANNKFAVYRTCKLQPIGNRKGAKKVIHVNQAMIAHNRKNPKKLAKPPITIQTSKGSIRASNMEIEGPSELIYRPLDPLTCGARLWIETTAPVKLDNNCSRLI